MKKVLIVNSVSNVSSTGRIADSIGGVAIDRGWEAYTAYGRGAIKGKCSAFSVASRIESCFNAAWCRIFDSDSPLSRLASAKIAKFIREQKPDIIHLHNLHGYYLHAPSLLEFLAESEIPIVWTLHDCWPFTGHCSYFGDCVKWKTRCQNCPKKRGYPSSLIFDNSKANFEMKLRFAQSAKNLTLVPVSRWLENLLRQSFYSGAKIEMIHNGIDVEKFSPRSNSDEIRAKYGLDARSVALGVANAWSASKGYADFIKLSRQLKGAQIVMVGVSASQRAELARFGIKGILKTHSQSDLAEIYSLASAFLNPTYNDNYPTVNLEAISCGTPVITYNTGGSPEAVDSGTGAVVERGDVGAMARAFERFAAEKCAYSGRCRKKALAEFSDKDKFNQYADLYESLAK